jgi:hypothetical protein
MPRREKALVSKHRRPVSLIEPQVRSIVLCMWHSSLDITTVNLVYYLFHVSFCYYQSQSPAPICPFLLFSSRLDQNILVAPSTRHTRTLHPHFTRIIAISRKILPKLRILLINRVLADVRQQENQPRSDKRKRRCHEERVTSGSDLIVARSFLERVERIGAGESANFSDSSRDAVVLTTMSVLDHKRCKSVGVDTYRIPVAHVFEATRPILSPGPNSPRARKTPYTTTKPAMFSGLFNQG